MRSYHLISLSHQKPIKITKCILSGELDKNEKHTIPHNKLVEPVYFPRFLFPFDECASQQKKNSNANTELSTG